MDTCPRSLERNWHANVQPASYAATESERADLRIRFAPLLPQLTPATDLERFGPAPIPDQVGNAVLDLTTDPNLDQTA